MAADPRPRSGGLANGGGGGAKRGTVKQHNVPEARPSPRSIWPDPQDRQPASIQAPRGATSLGVRLVLLMRPRPATRLSLQLNLSSSLDQLCAGASASMSAMTRPTPVVGGETEARRRGSGQSAAAARVGQRWFRDSLRFLRERKDLESARTMRLSASGSRETVPVDGRDAVTCSVTVLPNPRRAGAGMVGHFLSPPPPPPSAPSAHSTPSTPSTPSPASRHLAAADFRSPRASRGARRGTGGQRDGRRKRGRPDETRPQAHRARHQRP